MSEVTEYLVTIAGVIHLPGQRDTTATMMTAVVDIPNDWEEFEIQQDAIERLFAEGNYGENARSAFVLQCYDARPNKRKILTPIPVYESALEKPKGKPAGNDWMKDFELGVVYRDGTDDTVAIMCKTCAAGNANEEFYDVTKWAFEHRKVCAKK